MRVDYIPVINACHDQVCRKASGRDFKRVCIFYNGIIDRVVYPLRERKSELALRTRFLGISRNTAAAGAY